MSNDQHSIDKDLTSLTRDELLHRLKTLDKDHFLRTLYNDHYKKYARRPR